MTSAAVGFWRFVIRQLKGILSAAENMLNEYQAMNDREDPDAIQRAKTVILQGKKSLTDDDFQQLKAIVSAAIRDSGRKQE